MGAMNEYYLILLEQSSARDSIAEHSCECGGTRKCLKCAAILGLSDWAMEEVLMRE